MYVLLLPLVSRHNSICCRRRSKVCKTKTLVNREGFLHFVQMNTKYLFDNYRYYQYTKVYHINIYTGTCVVSLQSRRNALNEHFDTISCTVHVFNVLVDNVIK